MDMENFLNPLYKNIIDLDRIPFAMAAVLLSMAVGSITGPRGDNANPLFWILIDKLLGAFGDRLNRIHRPRADLVFRGFLLSAFGLFLIFPGALFLETALREYDYGGIVQPFVLSLLLTSGAVWFLSMRLYDVLEKKEIQKGILLTVSRSTRTNLNAGDDMMITRRMMGFTASSFDKGMVSPLLWYVIGGFPAALIYSILAALSWRFAKEGKTKGFGVIPSICERVMGIVPSLLAAFCISLASVFTPTTSIRQAFSAWGPARGKAKYEQGGLPLTALSWALNVGLGGAYQDLSGTAVKTGWVGPEGGTARNNHKHLRRSLYISIVAHLLFLGFLGGAYLLL